MERWLNEHLLLQKIDGTIEVIKYIDTVKATIAAFQEGLQADLLFMDIHLADGNSFEIFSQIQMDIPIIFTTAYDNYAIQAFKQNSIDYLLKPISIQDLQFAIEKYKKQQHTSQKQFIENVTQAYRQLNKEYKTRFLVKMGANIATVQTNEISHNQSSFSQACNPYFLALLQPYWREILAFRSSSKKLIFDILKNLVTFTASNHCMCGEKR